MRERAWLWDTPTQRMWYHSPHRSQLIMAAGKRLGEREGDRVSYIIWCSHTAHVVPLTVAYIC